MAKTLTMQHLEKTMNDRFSKQEKDFESALAFNNETLLMKFSEIIKVKITETIEETIKPLIAEITGLKSRVSQLESKIKGMEIRLDASKRQNNIIISGIPGKQKENLQEIIQGVLSQLGSTHMDFEYAQRLNTGADTNKSLILLRLKHQKDKQQLMSTYFKNFNLHLGKIAGFQEPAGRVFLNHDLSKESQGVLKLVVTLKKNLKIASHRVIDGQIAVKFKKDDRNFRIISNHEALQLSQE